MGHCCWFLGFLVGKLLGCEGGLGEALAASEPWPQPWLEGEYSHSVPAQQDPGCEPPSLPAAPGTCWIVAAPGPAQLTLLRCGGIAAPRGSGWVCLQPESELLWDAVISTETELFVLLESSRGNWLSCVCQLSSKLPLLRFDFPASDPALPPVPAASKGFHLGSGCALEQWQELSVWLLLLEQGCAVRFPLGLCLSFNLSPSDVA